ncbi:MAG: AMP-binding protein [Cyanobacteria bacterium REEB67]|nr:AMP-binding protein [Cyanobacteria bacterium REEB67]
MSLEIQPKEQKASTENSRTLRSLIDDFDSRGAHPALISFSARSSDTVSYGAFYQAIKNMARGFAGRGLIKGDSVVFFAPNSPAWVISCLSVIYYGGLAVPMDSQQSDEVLEHIVKDCQAKFICTDAKGAERVARVCKKKDLKIILLDKDDEHAEDSWKNLAVTHGAHTHKSDVAAASSGAYVEPLPWPEIGPGDFTLLFYTSGTTGMPKGAPLTHANILMQLESVIAKLDLLRPADRVLLPLPLFHVYPLNIGLFAPLVMGLPVVMPRSLTGPEIKRAINQGQVTVIIAVPRLIRSLYQAIEKKFYANKVVGVLFDGLLAGCGFIDNNCHTKLGKFVFSPVHKQLGPTLRMFTSGGAPIEPALAAKIRALGFDLACGYGLTETSPLLALRMPADNNIDSAGEPIPGVEVRIVPLEDKEAQGKSKNGEGEVQARGPNVFSGYLNLPDKTKEAFSADGWFRTGDLGYLKGKRLYIVGRASSTIVMEGGEKIQPDDIEERLSKLDGIEEVALLQRDHKLVALVVPDGKVPADKGGRDAIANHLKEAAKGAASYLAVTDFAITEGALPRTNLGKVKRFELQEIYDKAKAAEKSANADANRGEKSAGGEGGSSLSSADQALMQEPSAQKCMEWLKGRYLDHDITLETNPTLDLGIDSLEWMNLTMELLEQTGAELTEDAIARVTTVRDLLNEVNQAGEGGGGEGKLSPLEDPDDYIDAKQRQFVEPLSPGQMKQSRLLYDFCMRLMQPFEVEAIGRENLPAGQFVLTPNHASYIDAFAIVAALPYARLQKTQWAGWVGIAYANPLFAYLSRLGQVIPIDAKNSLLTSLAMAAMALKNGKNLVWFPEGERTLDGNLLPFKAGIGKLLQKSEVPIVPCYLKDTARALPPGRYFPVRHKIKVYFGQPVTAAVLAAEGKKNAGAKEKDKSVPELTALALHDRVEALAKIAHGEAEIVQK